MLVFFSLSCQTIKLSEVSAQSAQLAPQLASFSGKKLLLKQKKVDPFSKRTPNLKEAVSLSLIAFFKVLTSLPAEDRLQTPCF